MTSQPTPPHNELLEWLLNQTEAIRLEQLSHLSEEQRKEFSTHWQLWARKDQLPPENEWRIWLIMAGRGFGKTRAGAEWVRAIAEHCPEARIALVASSLVEARAVMVEGESGILGVCPPNRCPNFEPSLRRLVWPNGAQALLYSAQEADSLRGPQHSHAWCDEIAKWDNANGRAIRTWDNLMLGMRLGEDPRVLATTTPRAVALVHRLVDAKADDIAITSGHTEDNERNLPARFIRDIRREYGKSMLGRQELDGELIREVEGALWSRALLEGCRENGTTATDQDRVVIGVDPPASAGGDACGIIVCALAEDGVARVLADASVAKASPERWARAVANAARVWQADRVVAEANQGGAMVASVLRAAEVNLPLMGLSRG